MKNDKLPISIVIPCAYDLRLSQCIESVDENAEVIIVLNGPTQKIRDLVKQYPVKTFFLKERNLGAALNIGIRNASYDKVLLMDSDCVFEKGTIKLLYNGLENFKLSKGKVIFHFNNFFNKILAKAREYTTSDTPSAYKPPLALKKSVIDEVGYYFDDDVHWTEDADFDQRVRTANVSINFIPSAVIYHPPVTLIGDLRSASRYGIGRRIRVEKGIAKGLESDFRYLPDAAHKKGILVGVYLFFWNIAYSFGYIFQFLFDPYNVRKKFKK